MSLYLHYIDSISPYLDEILSPLIQEHFAFKLRDSFRILVPNIQCRKDLETAFLKHEELGNVLIGKSILTIEELILELLKSHPTPFPLANHHLNQKAWQLVLQQDSSDQLKAIPPKQACYEIKRLIEFQPYTNRLEQIQQQLQKRFPLFKNFHHLLEGPLAHWSEAKASEEAWQLLANKIPSRLEQIREWYFLGFEGLSRNFYQCLKVLIYQAEVKINLFLPPPSQLLDPQGLWQKPLEQIEQWATEVIHHKPVPLPKMEVHSYLTILHETRDIPSPLGGEGQGEGGGDQTLYLGPKQILSHLRSISDETFSTAPFEILSSIEKTNENSMLTFSQLLDPLLTQLHDLRIKWAKQEQLLALPYLEACIAELNNLFKAETLQPEIKPLNQWIQEIKASFLDIKLSSFNPHTNQFIRTFNQGGLQCYAKIQLFNLNEQTISTSGTAPKLLGQWEDPLFYHERNLMLRARLYQSQALVRFSYAQYDLSGRALESTRWLQDFVEANKIFVQEHHDTNLPLAKRSEHPYFQENIQREQKRFVENEMNQDQGALTSLAIKESILAKINSRPLSASYLDEYAQCPWKFFAHWHLRLDKPWEEEMEINPMERGRLAHRLLEETLRSLHEEYFAKRKIPPWEVLAASLEEKIPSPLGGEGQGEGEAAQALPSLPKEIQANEIKRIHTQVLNLLKHEHETWSQTKKKLLPQYFEWGFGKKAQKEFLIQIQDGIKLPLTGIIDRIDIGEDDSILIIDYKSSNSDKLAKALRDGQSFQLYIYLQAVQELLKNYGKPIGGLYWDLKELKKNQGMVLKEAYLDYTTEKLRTRSFLKEEKFEEQCEELQNALKETLENIVSGNYRLEPKECGQERCAFYEVCRYETKN